MEGTKRKSYRVVASKNQIVFGKGIPSQLEDFIVFSNQTFKRLQKYDSKVLGVVRIENGSATNLMNNSSEKEGQNEVYIREDLIQNERGLFLFELISHIFLGAFSLLCIMGVQKKQIKNMIKGQCNVVFLPALFLSVLLGVIYFLFEYRYACEENWEWSILFIYFGLVAGYLAIELIYYFFVKLRLYQAVMKAEIEYGINTGRTD